MATVTFDTLKFVERLKAAGVPEGQAKAMAEAQRETFAGAMDFPLATKDDVKDVRTGVKELELQIAARFERIDGKINLLQWMLALINMGGASLILKTFLA
ncbi:MAG: DUF1640 domain-containing protein [Gammaproteobacteria bacterium]